MYFTILNRPETTRALRNLLRKAKEDPTIEKHFECVFNDFKNNPKTRISIVSSEQLSEWQKENIWDNRWIDIVISYSDLTVLTKDLTEMMFNESLSYRQVGKHLMEKLEKDQINFFKKQTIKIRD